MNVTPTTISGLLILEPRIYEDERGFFYESYNFKTFAEHVGMTQAFVQDNHSRSVRNVLRGLHYQIKQAQAKLIRVIAGEVFDVLVDIRRSSPTFGHWVGVTLSADNKREVWVPSGFAHGFLVLSEFAECLYKTTDYWSPEHERCLIWNDPDLGIQWPIKGEPLLSHKDRKGTRFKEAEVFP